MSLGIIRSVNENKPLVIYLQFSVLTVLWGVLYFPVLSSLIMDWYTNPSYSYGFLIPLISGYLIWGKRKQLLGMTIKPTLWGLLLFIFGLVMYIGGMAGSEPFMMRISIVVTLLGLIQFLCGNVLLREMLFPLGYLFLMIPMPYTLFKTTAFYLRMFNAQLSAGIIQWLGIPVFRESYFLHLPKITLEVADVCSGLFSLLSLMAIGTVYAYWTQRGWICRLVLIFSVIPIAVLSNNFRITVTAFLVYYFGNGVLDSFFHLFHGTVNFLLNVVLLVMMGVFLNWISSKPLLTKGKI